MRLAGVQILLVTMLVSLVGCDSTARSKDTIHLPPGDAASGKQQFVALGCISCHTVLDESLPEPEIAGPVSVRLGTSSSTGLTYAQLVTSIMNPSHRVSRLYLKKAAATGGPASMANYNEIVTIEQLSDLVAFLAPHYARAARPGYKYPVYKYGTDEPKRKD